MTLIHKDISLLTQEQSPTGNEKIPISDTKYITVSQIKPTASSDITADKANTDKMTTPKSVYDFVKPASQSSQPAGGMEPGILYNLDVLTGSVTIALASPSDANVANEYAFTFFTGATAPTITWPNSILAWAGNCIVNGAPLIIESKYYEVSVLNGIAIIIETEV